MAILGSADNYDIGTLLKLYFDIDFCTVNTVKVKKAHVDGLP